MYFGLTNDPIKYRLGVLYRIAAISDGWGHKDMYGNDTSSTELTRDGFVMVVTTRKFFGGKFKYQVDINIWGPDELAIIPPDRYNMRLIRQGLTTCNYCLARNVKTQRVSFAGRCCKNCLPIQQIKLEYPGWTK